MFLTEIPLETLKSELQQIVRAEMISTKKSDLEEKLLSPAEVCKLPQPSISRVTLDKWTKDGKLKEHRIGARIYYKYSDVMESLQTIKKYRRA